MQTVLFCAKAIFTCTFVAGLKGINFQQHKARPALLL
jgi:hypothetical protein